MKTIQLFTMKMMIKSKITVVKRDELGKLIQQTENNLKMKKLIKRCFQLRFEYCDVSKRT